MEQELILTKLHSFELSHFRHFCIAGYGVCVVHSFQQMFLKLGRLVVDIFKMCVWCFDEAQINFDVITAFLDLVILDVCFAI